MLKALHEKCGSAAAYAVRVGKAYRTAKQEHSTDTQAQPSFKTEALANGPKRRPKSTATWLYESGHFTTCHS